MPCAEKAESYQNAGYGKKIDLPCSACCLCVPCQDDWFMAMLARHVFLSNTSSFDSLFSFRPFFSNGEMLDATTGQLSSHSTEQGWSEGEVSLWRPFLAKQLPVGRECWGGDMLAHRCPHICAAVTRNKAITKAMLYQTQGSHAENGDCPALH